MSAYGRTLLAYHPGVRRTAPWLGVISEGPVQGLSIQLMGLLKALNGGFPAWVFLDFLCGELGHPSRSGAI